VDPSLGLLSGHKLYEVKAKRIENNNPRHTHTHTHTLPRIAQDGIKIFTCSILGSVLSLCVCVCVCVCTVELHHVVSRGVSQLIHIQGLELSGRLKALQHLIHTYTYIHINIYIYKYIYLYYYIYHFYFYITYINIYLFIYKYIFIYK